MLQFIIFLSITKKRAIYLHFDIFLTIGVAFFTHAVHGLIRIYSNTNINKQHYYYILKEK